MNRPGAGILSIVCDPEDEAQLTHQALTAHDPGRRQITVHPTAGTSAAAVLALDILAALGATITAETAKREHLSGADKAFAAAAAWIAAFEIDVVIVLRTHTLSPTARGCLGRLATDAQVRVVAVWHGRRPVSFAGAFAHPAAMTREIEGLDAVLAASAPTLPTAAHRAVAPGA